MIHFFFLFIFFNHQSHRCSSHRTCACIERLCHPSETHSRGGVRSDGHASRAGPDDPIVLHVRGGRGGQNNVLFTAGPKDVSAPQNAHERLLHADTHDHRLRLAASRRKTGGFLGTQAEVGPTALLIAGQRVAELHADSRDHLGAAGAGAGEAQTRVQRRLPGDASGVGAAGEDAGVGQVHQLL